MMVAPDAPIGTAAAVLVLAQIIAAIGALSAGAEPRLRRWTLMVLVTVSLVCMIGFYVATIIGMVPFGTKIEIPGHEVFMQEKVLRGSMMGSNQFRLDMPRFIQLYLDGKLMLDEMVSHRIKLDQINDGYDMMRRRETTRTVITFD